MAKLIIDHANSEDIPQSSISILRDVVSLRKKSARFFGKLAAQSEDAKIQKSNSSHEHIVKILENILAQLEAAVAKIEGKPKSTSLDAEGQVGMDHINNMFKLLKVEEIQRVDDAESAKSDLERINKKPSKKKYVKNRGKKRGQRREMSRRTRPSLVQHMRATRRMTSGGWIMSRKMTTWTITCSSIVSTPISDPVPINKLLHVRTLVAILNVTHRLLHGLQQHS